MNDDILRMKISTAEKDFIRNRFDLKKSGDEFVRLIDGYMREKKTG